MDKLLLIAQAEVVELLLDEVLDGLDVVIRHALNLLDSEGILGGEAQIDILIPSGQSEAARTYEYPGFGRLLETRGAQFGLERTRKASVLCANRQFTVNVPDGLGACTRKYQPCSTMEIPIKVGISETLFFCLRFLILKSVEISRRFLENRYIAFMTVSQDRFTNTPALFLTAS